MMTQPPVKQLVEAPASDSSSMRHPLAYIDGYDAVLNSDYAFAAYKEVDRDTGEWRVRIQSRQTSGVVFLPDAMRSQARAAGAQGKPFFTWGNGIAPSPSDPRHIEFRVHVSNGQPSAIEIFVQLRKFDHSADLPKSVTFPWPAAV